VIRATKYLDLETSVLRVAALILEALRVEPAISVDDLLARVDSHTHGRGRFNFFPAVNLLFLTGRVDYRESKDAVVSLMGQSAEAA
jgi:hypothetical protein